MTLYAPPTDHHAYRLVARRVLLGRPALVTACTAAVVFSMATSGNSPRATAETHPPAMSAIATAAVALSIPTDLPEAQQAPATLPDFDDANEMIRAVIKRAHPRFEARPLPDTEFQADISPADLPDEPKPTLRMASLIPPEASAPFDGDSLFPRIPDTTSLAIVPPVLPRHAHRDDPAEIDTDSGFEASATGAPASSEAEPARHKVDGVTAKGGETLAELLDAFSINDDDKRATLVALRADSIKETLSEDDRVDLAFTPNRKLGTNRLVAIRLTLDPSDRDGGRKLELRWDGEMYDLWAGLEPAPKAAAEESFRPVTTSEALGDHLLGMGEPERVFLQGVVKTSLYEAADDAGMTPGEAKTLTDIFRYLVDFERDLRPGDRFEVLFDKKENGDYGDIVYAMIENQGRQMALFRAQTGEESVEYFDRDGKTNRRALMRTPLAYARVSSNYGMRRHPIDGYRKMHKGVDFRARTGTPIVAAGNGIVDYVGRRGGYGKYIRIRHNTTYKTAYAHLSRYRKGLTKGARVKQGDIIGYVGSTGRSTGPHLHFEVLENGKQINPMSVGDFGPIRSLTGSELARFKARIARINLVLAEMRPATVIATVE